MRVLAAMLVAATLTACASRTIHCDDPALPFPMTKEWLKKRVTPQEAERAHMVNGVPFGYINDQWRDLREAMQPGDELWLYNGSFPGPREPSALAVGGQEGYVLLRGCVMIKRIITLIS